MRNTIYSAFALAFFLIAKTLFAQAVPAPANDTVTPPTTQQMDARTDDSILNNNTKQMTTAPAQLINDERIVGILLAANGGEIKSAGLAQSRAQGKEVKDYAKQMIDDHGKANNELKAISSKLHIQASGSEIQSNLEASAKASELRLQALKGREFDKVYIDEQVTMHQTVLDTIDQKLLPAAKAPDLKAHLEEIRPVIAKHLDHARSMATSKTVGR